MIQNFKLLVLFVFTYLNLFGQDSLFPFILSKEDELNFTYKEYFFDDKLQINESTSLVILIKEPQTQMARELGNRIYRDTSFIRKIKNQFYEVKEIKNGEGQELIHFCGHDMYFYLLSNGNMTYLNKLNSNCGLSEISCNDLSILFESGKKLRQVRLTSLPEKYIKSRDGLFSDKVITSYYENQEFWDICKSSRYPNIYYDGFFDMQVAIDPSITINQNIENKLKSYVRDMKDVNWNASSYLVNGKLAQHKKTNEPIIIEIRVFVKKKAFKFFKTFDIKPITFRKLVFNEDEQLLLFYDD